IATSRRTFSAMAASTRSSSSPPSVAGRHPGPTPRTLTPNTLLTKFFARQERAGFMTLATRFTKEFGVRHPVVCGGMTAVGTADLIAAVANAGGLGFFTAPAQPTRSEERP